MRRKSWRDEWREAMPDPARHMSPVETIICAVASFGCFALWPMSLIVGDTPAIQAASVTLLLVALFAWLFGFDYFQGGDG